MTTSHSAFLYILHTLLLFSLPLNITSSARTEADALVIWKLTLSSSSFLDSWSIADRPNLCNWTSIVCNSGETISGINLSEAGLSGSLDQLDFTSFPSLTSFKLNRNSFSGSIPANIGNASMLTFLDLSNNFLEGVIPEEIGKLTRLEYLRFYYNEIKGILPYQISNLQKIRDMLNLTRLTVSGNQLSDLGRNNLKAAIPQCFGNMRNQLEVLDMHNNNLSGTHPTKFSIGSVLRSFIVRDNKLEGKIPQYLGNCKELQVLDFGNNCLNDSFPMWLGTLRILQVLILRSNKLHGTIRTSRIENMFPALRIIDLSYNLFTGNLLMSLFHKLKAMRTDDHSTKEPSYLGDRYYQDSVTNATKGIELKLVRILVVYTAIDLSSNIFEGRIPSMLGDLNALRGLNFSHNGLQGHIPPSLGKLSLVESLGLSSNQLSGEIPGKLASLTFLAVLNLSHNHLEGCIPRESQFATFENNSYEGNHGLRGFPLSKVCG